MAIPKKDTLSDLLTDPLPMAALAGGGGFPPELAALLTRRLAKEMARQDQEEEELRRLLEARSASFNEEIEGRKRAQDWCPHRKEDQRSRIGGQRLSDGTVLYICQYCAKEWRGNELPPSLQVSLDIIGG